jgi:uncharacterized lipoprotein YajG
MKYLMLNKRLLVSALTALLILTLLACGESQTTQPATNTTAPAQPTNQTQNITDQVRQVVTGSDRSRVKRHRD